MSSGMSIDLGAAGLAVTICTAERPEHKAHG